MPMTLQRPPATYDEVDTDVYKTQAPQWSIAARVDMPDDQAQMPGPGAHCPEKINLKKCAPAFTFGVRHSEYIVPVRATAKKKARGRPKGSKTKTLTLKVRARQGLQRY